MKGNYGYVVKTIITTFVIIFPQFILKNHPFFADIIGVFLAILVNVEWKQG